MYGDYNKHFIDRLEVYFDRINATFDDDANLMKAISRDLL